MAVLNLIIAGIGLASTLAAWFLNPQRKKNKLRSQLVDVYKQLEKVERQRDEALQKNDTDILTVATDTIKRLRNTKADLLQQLGQS